MRWFWVLKVVCGGLVIACFTP
ncbi:DUF3265 domain-containing protein [Vibrio vulnificus]|nr:MULTISPECIES: DUF3265 domain-containing protein [Vibrio]MCG6291535.1 DUF3265 domain-containing protein [Vibrio vulnificus]MCG6478140.1 DUF3265 domain-containing protein [Vibrio parahaemolyticus]MCG6508322.1 DUF3265 domain-containing protein [Vibrio parahaemolyticus]MCJ0806817.1 DUF3265 domain-containing protein [Vibrio vulnificus]MCR9501719.1 DUF3265 domain-containing protein [Vibrio vulnificus]